MIKRRSNAKLLTMMSFEVKSKSNATKDTESKKCCNGYYLGVYVIPTFEGSIV